MWTTHLATTVAFARRAVRGLGLAVTLVVLALGPLALPPAHGQTERDHRGQVQQPLPAPPALQARMAPGDVPRARLQLVVKSIRILDDRDLGDGEFRLTVHLGRCPSAPATCAVEDPPGYLQQAPGTAPLTESAPKHFSAGERTVGLDWVLPQATDRVWGGYDLSDDAGYPVFTAQRYLLRLDLWELDVGNDDFMGTVTLMLREEDGWGVGTHTMRGLFQRGGQYFITDYEAWFEVRRTPLPDLAPTAIRVVEGAGGIDSVCMTVVNAGWEPAGPFPLTLSVDGTDHRVATVQVAGLAAGETHEACVSLPGNLDMSGRHHLGASADEAGTMPELNEFNNHVDLAVDRTPPPTPTATPIPALADLTVTTIRVRGRVPDGKDDCKDGKNDVTAVVKNRGTASAGAFTVSLAVDKEQVADEPVPGLGAGEEREVRFDDIRLKKGERTLTATIDAAKTITESDESNNALTVTAACKDDD
jgi:hypothetical protein